MNLSCLSSKDLPLPKNDQSGWPWIEGVENTLEGGFNWPKISIITPSYNQAKFLEETIRSVLLQGYPNLEYIIIDGGSTDGSIEIIKKYEQWIYYWASEKDKGQTYAIQKGMKKATGELVNWLNSDDILLPNALKAVASKFVSLDAPNQKAVICGSALHINETGEIVKELPIRFVEESERILPMAPPYSGGIQASWFLTRDAWLYLDGIDTSLDYTMDTDLYYRCHKNEFPFYPIASTLAAYRVHNDTKTLHGWEKSIEFKRIFYKRKLSEISIPLQSNYARKVGLLLFGFCLKSITAQDNLLVRLKKIIKGFEIHPPALWSRYSIKRAISVLLNHK